MKISVIIPCHNAGFYLAQTIGSVLDQSHAAQEIIIIDDGSTDDSLDIARRFGHVCGPDLIRVYSERSGNATRTRNLGAALATGDALMFLDADDVLAPHALESLAGALADQPGGIAACPWRRLDFVNGQWLSRPPSCAPRQPDQDALSGWLTGWYYPPCAVLWSKKAFLQTGGWDEEAALNQDGDLMMRALVSGIPLIETASGTAYYRRLPEGQISLSGKRHTYGGIAGRIAVIEKVARMLKEQHRIDTYRVPLGKAFSMIAFDAAWQYAGLCEQARANMRQYGPSLLSRAMARTRRWQSGSGGTKPAAAPPYDQVEEIRFGLDRAKRVFAEDTSTKIENISAHSLPERPTVSVIIPVYNRAHLLPRTIESVLKQKLTDFEVLIIDDCSRDDPASVVSNFKDSRLRYLRQPENRGVAAARNRGLQEACAPFVAFLDDDDEWFPEKLAMQVDLFHRSPPDVGLIYTGVETVLCDGSRTLQEPVARGDLYRELLVRNILHGAGSSIMMRRNVVAKVGFFDGRLPAIEDYDYWLRVCRHYKIDCISTPLIRYNDNRDLSGCSDDEVRRSLNVKANLEARNQFYIKHGAQMRKAGLAHLFLVDSAHRHLAPVRNDMNAARRLALHAFVLAPTSWEARNLLLKTFIPIQIKGIKK